MGLRDGFLHMLEHPSRLDGLSGYPLPFGPCFCGKPSGSLTKYLELKTRVICVVTEVYYHLS